MLINIIFAIFAKLLLGANMSCRSSLTWKKPVTRSGNMAFFVICMYSSCLHDFTSTFLNERCFRVLVGSCLSDLYDQEDRSDARCHFICYFVHIEHKQYHQMFASWRERFGVCRWLLYLFPLEKFNSNRTTDSVVYQQHSKMGWWERISIRKLQNGMHAIYSAPYSANADLDLKLYGACIPVVSEFKFLGLIFDKKLTFNKHIKYLKDKW